MRAIGLFLAMLAGSGLAAAAAYALGAPGGTPVMIFLVALYALIRVHRVRVDTHIAHDLLGLTPPQREHLLSGLKPRDQRRIRKRLARMER